MTPSVYETAQVLRFCPNLIDVDNVIHWLLTMQRPDGGWGEEWAPMYRDVPTLAAILALRSQDQCARINKAWNDGVRFLEEQSTCLQAEDGEYLSAAIELIVPTLLDQAGDMGLYLVRERFRYLEDLGAQRRRLIASHPPVRDSPPLFSWEAWGTDPAPELVGCGGVGHSPAATAWWLHLDAGRTATGSVRERAASAIVRASYAAGTGTVGLVPGAWPMNRFEQSFVLYTVATAGLLTHPKLISTLAPQLEDMRSALTYRGLGFSDTFAPDGDDTAAAVAALTLAGLPVDCDVLRPFQRAAHFVAYPFETHGSYTVTARAVQALRILGYPAQQWIASILDAQQCDGWWPSDKWSASRLYGTYVALAALDESAGYAKVAAAEAFLRYQHSDGGWGCFGQSTLVETAFGVFALRSIAAETGRGGDRACCEALAAAHRYLRTMYNPHRIGTEYIWLTKDLGCVRHIDHALILCALLVSANPAPVPGWIMDAAQTKVRVR